MQEYCTCPTAWWGIYPPPLCAYCKYWKQYQVPIQGYIPPYISETEIERIAKRVAEIIKGSK